MQKMRIETLRAVGVFNQVRLGFFRMVCGESHLRTPMVFPNPAKHRFPRHRKDEIRVNGSLGMGSGSSTPFLTEKAVLNLLKSVRVSS